MQVRRGRRRGSPDTRAEILDAAREEFADHGYEGSTIRAIAARASVDPSLVMHYFGSKEELFTRTLDIPISPAMVMRRVFSESPGAVGETLVLTMLTYWDDAGLTGSFVSVLRSVTGEGPVHDLVVEFIESTILDALTDALDGPDAALRASLIGSQLVGLLVGRYLLELDELVHASPETLANRVGPVIDHYAFGK